MLELSHLAKPLDQHIVQASNAIPIVGSMFILPTQTFMQLFFLVWCCAAKTLEENRTPSKHHIVLFAFRHKYEFLHNGWSPDLRITAHPLRIGVALDYDRGTLSFFNANLEQHLHTFHCHFQNYVHPCFSLDNPGALTLHNGIAAPDYAFIWLQEVGLTIWDS